MSQFLLILSSTLKKSGTEKWNLTNCLDLKVKAKV